MGSTKNQYFANYTKTRTVKTAAVIKIFQQVTSTTFAYKESQRLNKQTYLEYWNAQMWQKGISSMSSQRYRLYEQSF